MLCMQDWVLAENGYRKPSKKWYECSITEISQDLIPEVGILKGLKTKK